jgi:glycosyltransferase involved in cell wall biosynthesis
MSRVLFVQATDPAAYPPLIHAGRLMVERGHRVRFLSSPIAGRAMRMPVLPGLEVEALPERPTHVMSPANYARYLAATLRAVRAFRPDIVYASDPFGALPGLLAARMASAPLVYHEHDSPDSERSLHRAVRLARRAALRRARLVVFPNEGRAREVAADVPFATGRLRIVWNLPRRSEVPQPLTRAPRPLVLYYHGSITRDRLPVTVLDAVLRFDGNVRLDVAGYETAGGVGHLAALRVRADAAGLPCALRVNGEVPERADLARLMSEAHIGLALMPTSGGDINMRHMTGASNKAFDYLSGELALLVSDLPDWRAMFVAPGLARACDPASVDSIAAAIRWFIEHPDETGAMGERGRLRMLDAWNYDTAFAPVLAELGLDQ